ncbi:mannose-6-phosphate isomerase, class I [Microbacterium sp. NPDC057407]|uniref:mannose-6-phosphate isomerase, class I n=1 Tax=Microbacterium sp. NPDC057407 TaxID=3346120 RepID=UPI0036710EFE
MLIPLTNEPRDYSWGSPSLIADLEGRAPSGRPEAEVWFGDHPGDPAVIPDGRTLAEWLSDEAARTGSPERLPFLLKLLAAASALSIQAHPSRTQAEAGFAHEEEAGIPRDAAERTYRDANHKPELIVAVSPRFRALAGLRDLDATRRLAAALGPGGAALAERLEADASPRDLVRWALSPHSAAEVRGVLDAARSASSDEFAAELELARALHEGFPGDPGILVALLMNLVTLREGEGMFVPAGVLHAYLEGLGVELMAASDNVLRGGLTPKHIDVAELLAVLDDRPGLPPIVRPRPEGPGRVRYDVPVADFSLVRVDVGAGVEVRHPLDGAAIVLATAGGVRVEGSAGAAPGASGGLVDLAPGAAAFASPDERALVFSGTGTVFVASQGREQSSPA